MLFPCEVFFFFFFLTWHLHIYLSSDFFFLHIFFNPPADTSAHVPEAPPSLLCGHQSYCTQLQSLLFASVHFTSEIEFSKLVHSKLHLCKLLSCRISISHVLMKHNNDNSLCKMLTMLVNTDDGLYIYYSHLHLCSHLKHHCFCSDFELHPSNMHKTPACQCLIKTV